MSERQPITQPETLSSLCQELLTRPAIALDTEFERRNTFFAKLALIQIHDGDRAWLVDPLALPDLSPIGTLLGAYRGTVVMHAPLEDLEILQRATGHLPQRLFDTQLAATLAGLGPNLGYDRLMQSLFEVVVSKAVTRSDWLHRPLSPSQIDYAITDTAHLLPAQRQLEQHLIELERTAWLDEEIARLVQRVDAPEAERDFVRLVRRVDDDDGARGMLLSLLRWREEQARRRDVPRRRLAEDNLVVACVNHAVREASARDELPDLSLYKRRVSDRQLLSAIARAAEAERVPRPPQAEDLRPLKRQMKAAREALERLSQSLALPMEVLAPKRMMEQLAVAELIRNESPPTEFMGWRRDTVLPALIAALRS